MKITKLGHSCLLVEMPAPLNRTALFDPGVFSKVDVKGLAYLDDIFITHIHADHMDPELMKKLVTKFPEARITATPEIVTRLKDQGIIAHSEPPEGAVFFDSPHEAIRPLYAHEPPQEIGVHYLDKLSHPGDSHSFSETKEVLALPVQAPWGSARDAVKLGLKLKPTYIIPVHDWHWNPEARKALYQAMEEVFDAAGITFISPIDGEPFVLDV
jgi:L-ascorbate metabolism protein UlaG (beta-lactamase superfamily)